MPRPPNQRGSAAGSSRQLIDNAVDHLRSGLGATEDLRRGAFQRRRLGTRARGSGMRWMASAEGSWHGNGLTAAGRVPRRRVPPSVTRIRAIFACACATRRKAADAACGAVDRGGAGRLEWHGFPRSASLLTGAALNAYMRTPN
eukprot:365108-Chlamydomonas_euryale.AAC.6